MRREAEQLFPGGIRFLTLSASTPQGGWGADGLKWRSGTDLQTLDAAGAAASRAQGERMFPHLVLRQAEQAGDSLTSSDGRRLSYRDPAGEQIQLAFDPLTGLMTRAAQMRDGAAQSEVLYGDYERREGVMLPRTVQVLVGGRLQEDVRLGRTRFGQAPDERFAAPGGYAPPPPAGQPALRALAPGAYVFDHMPAGYRAMLVDAGDHFVLLEAPLNPAYGERQRELIRAMAPDKPVRYVLVTHPHGDHTGGLKPWVEGGAILVAPKGAGVALRRQLATRGVTRPVVIEEVADRRSLGSGAGRVDLYAFAGSHSAGNLIAHLPAADILFQGDLLYVPDRGEPPAAFGITGELMRELRRRKLAPRTFVGVHGRPATRAEAEESLRRARAGKPAAR
jgi:glyoxylase-like metal-dependent hydrolase (beta-lactamase superfamily II)